MAEVRRALEELRWELLRDQGFGRCSTITYNSEMEQRPKTEFSWSTFCAASGVKKDRQSEIFRPGVGLAKIVCSNGALGEQPTIATVCNKGISHWIGTICHSTSLLIWVPATVFYGMSLRRTESKLKTSNWESIFAFADADFPLGLLRGFIAHAVKKLRKSKEVQTVMILADGVARAEEPFAEEYRLGPARRSARRSLTTTSFRPTGNSSDFLIDPVSVSQILKHFVFGFTWCFVSDLECADRYFLSAKAWCNAFWERPSILELP